VVAEVVAVPEAVAVVVVAVVMLGSALGSEVSCFGLVSPQRLVWCLRWQLWHQGTDTNFVLAQNTKTVLTPCALGW